MQFTKFILKLAVSAALLILVFHSVDFYELKKNIASTRFLLFGAALPVLLLLLFLPATAQRIILRPLGLSLTVRDIYPTNLQGMFYALVLPGDIAGGMARLYKFSRAHRRLSGSADPKFSRILLMIGLDRLVNIGALTLLTLLFFLHAPPFPRRIWFFALTAGCAFLFLLFLIFARRLPWERIVQKLSRLKPFRRRAGLPFDCPPREATGAPLFFSFLITLIYQMGCVVTVDILLASSLGLRVPWPSFIFAAAAIRLLRLIPVTVSGIGIREGLYPFFLFYYGVSPEKGVALGILGTALIVILGLSGGLLEIFSILRSRPR